MPSGKVKWFNNAKGYGFVTMEAGGDAFVHYKDIVGDGFKTLEEGEDIEFDLEDGPKGPKAMNIQRKTIDV